MSETRVSYLTLTEFRALDDWARLVLEMFGDPPYLVGSAVTSPTWRDVDLRLPLSDERYAELNRLVSIGRLNHVVSLWGERVTGLPVDFQLQPLTTWQKNAEKQPRPNPMGLREDQTKLVQGQEGTR